MSDDGPVSSLFPRRTPVSIGHDDARVVAIDGADDEAVFDALGSNTARRILAEVYDDPAPASEIADRVDTSLQNARYHLDNLQDAGLVEQVDTWYSSTGKEMRVYGRATGGLVLVAGTDSWRARVKRVLERLFTPLVLLAVAAFGVQRWLGDASRRAGEYTSYTTGGGDAGDPGVMSAENVEKANATADSMRTTTESVASGAAEAAGGVAALPPGLLFLAGGLFVAVVAGAWWLYRSR